MGAFHSLDVLRPGAAACRREVPPHNLSLAHMYGTTRMDHGINWCATAAGVGPHVTTPPCRRRTWRAPTPVYVEQAARRAATLLGRLLAVELRSLERLGVRLLASVLKPLAEGEGRYDGGCAGREADGLSVRGQSAAARHTHRQSPSCPLSAGSDPGVPLAPWSRRSQTPRARPAGRAARVTIERSA